MKDCEEKKPATSNNAEFFNRRDYKKECFS